MASTLRDQLNAPDIDIMPFLAGLMQHLRAIVKCHRRRMVVPLHISTVNTDDNP